MPSCSLDHEEVRWEGPEACWFCGGRPALPYEPPEDDDYYPIGVWG